MFEKKDVDYLKNNTKEIIFSEINYSDFNNDSFKNYLNNYGINFKKESDAVDHNFGFFKSKNYKISTHIWRPKKSKGTVFLLHGYTDNVGLMQHAIRNFLNENFTVICFDLPGHGLSSGERCYIESFDEYVEVLNDCLRLAEGNLPKPWFGVGQSTGGSIWLNYISRHKDDNKITTAVLLAPLVRIYNWHKLRYVFPLYRLFLKKKKRNFGVNSNDEIFLNFINKKDIFQPDFLPLRWVVAMRNWVNYFSKLEKNNFELCVVSGDKDKTVDADYNLKKIMKKFPKVEINILKNVHHQMVNESEKYRQEIFKIANDFLNKKL
jgi:lysophospholipase